jgi:hypothetical protein
MSHACSDNTCKVVQHPLIHNVLLSPGSHGLVVDRGVGTTHMLMRQVVSRFMRWRLAASASALASTPITPYSAEILICTANLRLGVLLLEKIRQSIDKIAGDIASYTLVSSRSQWTACLRGKVFMVHAYPLTMANCHGMSLRGDPREFTDQWLLVDDLQRCSVRAITALLVPVIGNVTPPALNVILVCGIDSMPLANWAHARWPVVFPECAMSSWPRRADGNTYASVSRVAHMQAQCLLYHYLAWVTK